MIHCEDPKFLDVVKEHLLYHKIVDVIQHGDGQTAELILDNGIRHKFHIHNSIIAISEMSEIIPTITTAAASFIALRNKNDGIEEYSLYVMTEDKRLNILTYEGDDNGYYGVGFYITVKERKQSAMRQKGIEISGN